MLLSDGSDRSAAIGRELLVESKEKELLWSAVPALGIDPATESQEDMTTQVGYPGSPASLSGNSTEEAPSLREGLSVRAGQSSYRLLKKRQQPFLLFLKALKARLLDVRTGNSSYCPQNQLRRLAPFPALRLTRHTEIVGLHLYRVIGYLPTPNPLALHLRTGMLIGTLPRYLLLVAKVVKVLRI